MLQRLLPKVKSPNELIKLFDRVDDATNVERLINVTADASKLSDDAIEGLLKMSDDELKALGNKSVDEIEEIIFKTISGAELPANWSKFMSKLNSKFAKRLERFRGNKDLTLNPKLRGGEGQIFTSELSSNTVLKRWFASRVRDMPHSIDLLISANVAVSNNSKLSSFIDVVKVIEKGDDWILRGFDFRSIPIKRAVSDPQVLEVYNATLKVLSSENQAITKSILKKFQKQSENVHWSPTHGKFIIIDML